MKRKQRSKGTENRLMTQRTAFGFVRQTNRFRKHKCYFHLVLSAKQFRRALKINTPTILKFYDSFDVLFVIDVLSPIQKKNHNNIITAATKSLWLQWFAMRGMPLPVSIVNILLWKPPQSLAREYLAQCEFYIWTITRLTSTTANQNAIGEDRTCYRNSLSFELKHQKMRRSSAKNNNNKKLYDHLSLFGIIFKLIWLCRMKALMLMLMLLPLYHCSLWLRQSA